MDNYANTNGTYGAHYHVHTQTWVNWQDAPSNTSSIHIRIYLGVDSGYSWGSVGGSSSARLNGGQVATGGMVGSGSGPGNFVLIDWDGNVGHDANGNWSGSAGGSLSTNWGGIGSGGGDWGWSLPRLALAPAISSVIADQIKPTSVRLGVEISSFGHGTSANMTMYYRVQGSGTWIDLGNQGDAAGYNYWAVTGLIPGKTYEYIANVWNNNGDFAQSGTQTFVTQTIPGMVPVLMGLM